ncbi:class V chitinase [Manihot esculenta]|uniref:GH18 domain-containing protein n=1 Tax=Manihot esculenta TaxID=3983 RepID=A0A2C9ULQ6_MANES|nr:class V chitinase [Manihot esculenta]OAY31428.1 hypothetical protein MANES_14G111400v8 [Manihot esculenta]
MATKVFPLFFAALLFLLQFHSSSAQNAVRGAYWYYGSGFQVSEIESNLFTHLFCAFADLDPQTNQVTIPSGSQAQFFTFTQIVQRKNPSVKTLLSIGGGGGDKVAAAFDSMASQASSRKTFIDSSISLARAYNFHGLDLDWEYPNTTTQMTNFGLLLNEWRAAVAAEAQNSGRTPLLLSAAVLYLSYYYSTSVPYPIQAVSNSLDWINLMAYDFYGPGWSNVTGPPAALYNPGTTVSGDYGVTSWINAGLQANKIVLGFPFFGRAWQLANASENGFFADTVGAALTDAVIYSEIEEFIDDNDITALYNGTYVSNYCYFGTTWIGYDDTQSVSAKVSYVKDKALLGYFAWQVSGDDDDWTLSRQAASTWGA